MSDNERIWRCSCGQAHFLTIHKWTDNSDPVFLVEGQVRGTLRYRLRQAMRLLTNRGHEDAWLEVCLDTRTIRELRDHLSGLLDEPVIQVSYSGVNTTATAPPVIRKRP